MLLGRIEGWGFCVVPKASSIDACTISSTPSEDTSFASGAALRSGLNATSSISTPTASVKTNVKTSDGGVSNRIPSSPVFSAQKQ